MRSAGPIPHNTVDGVQRVTQVTSDSEDHTSHPGTLATLSYTPWGAISTVLNGCTGSGCVQAERS